MPPENQPTQNPNLIEPGPFEQVADPASGKADPATPVVDPAQPPAEGSEAPKDAQKAAPIFRGIQKEFSNLEDLSKYTLELEKQTLEQQARLSGMASVGNPAAPTQSSLPDASAGLNYEKLGEEFILNPKGAVQKIIEHVQSSVMGSVNQHVGRTEFYRSFYEANEDLVGCEDLVDASVQKNSQAWKNIPTEQAAKLLASDVRARVMKIRGSAPGDVVLSGKAPHALPSGGNPAPKSTSQVAPEVLSFTAQLKKEQAKHKSLALKH